MVTGQGQITPKAAFLIFYETPKIHSFFIWKSIEKHGI